MLESVLSLHIIFTMATPHPKSKPGDLTTFNIQHGFAEALVRGMRSSFLKDADYHHLTQCETLDDVKLNLTETDYAEALADSNAITPAAFQKVAVDKVGHFFSIAAKQAYEDSLMNSMIFLTHESDCYPLLSIGHCCVLCLSNMFYLPLTPACH